MRKIFHNDTVIRVVSVLISILLWMYVVGVNNPTISVLIRAVPVQTTNIENADMSHLEVISLGVETIDVRVEGRHADVSKVTAEDILAQVDVSEIERAGKYELGISLDTNITGVSLTNVTASKTIAFVDERVEEYKDIIVKTKGDPKEGFTMVSCEPQYKQVLVSGPKTYVEKVKGAAVWVDISGADGTLSEKGYLTLFDIDGKNSDVTYLDTDGLKSTLVTVKFNLEKEVEITPVFESSEINSRFDVAVVPEKVKISGDADVLKEISKIETHVITLSEEQLMQSNLSIDVKLNLPEKVTVSEDVHSYKVTLIAK